ncbi:MAG: putative bifunctional diguanylate cyclase/phosphodiesterase, partial [Pontibacterium sp.]
MTSLSDLQQDKSFRLRLILACVAIALLVSSIYVVVSYRLSADLGVETELASLEKQTQIFHSGLVADHFDLTERANSIASKLFVDALADDKMYISAFNATEHWEFSQHFSRDEVTKLIQAMSSSPGANSGVFKLGRQQYIWLNYQGAIYDVLIVRTTSALDDSLLYVAKRLSITTMIVFWISIWSALTLSSLIAKRVQKKNDALARLATHDTLTGLPNRLYLVDYMEKNLPKPVELTSPAAITRPLSHRRSDPATYASLFVIDLDKFKEVNDSLGHSAGDKLLIEMGKRIAAFLSKDQLLVRTGGDEFLVWAPDVIGPSAEHLAKALVAECNKPFSINNLSINTGASIGIAYYPRHANTAETLIVKADTAMYEAKRQRCGWMVCNDNNLEDARDRLKLRADLGCALGLNQIVFYFQPKVDISTGKVMGAEALARWNHPTEGVLSPFHFIDLIERSGRVQEFGRYVLEKNISQLAQWGRRGLDLPIAVNLSP